MTYSPLTPLDGRVAVVTGGARGIGFESAKALRESGAKVVIVDINRDIGPKAAGELEADFLPADLTKSDQVAQVAADIVAKHDRIDIAFNNAGISVSVPSEESSDEQWLQIINVNLNAVFFCCREFGKVMLKQGKGSIINTASMSGVISNVPQPQSAYNTSKAGVIMLTKSLAGEWAKRGVRVNSVSPGYIGTEMTKEGMSNTDWYKYWLDFTPMGRVGEPSEVAAAVLFLASDASSYFTGSNLIVDGGYTCW
ncbi:MAG: SDR family oxidoreductase [Verrucomicrobia bacterium]|nr:SDR family oxidoreductase [Verrucomicrobiota bacterium]MBV8280025.1 SDR family oxidoreductase [Verrucomicrobiota bacterium]